MIKLKAANETDMNKSVRQEIKQSLDSLPPKIKQIKYFEVGINIIKSARAYDIVLISKFDSLEELNQYIEHPEHKKVLEIVNRHSENISSVDYKD
jgi:hypothetical protein